MKVICHELTQAADPESTVLEDLIKEADRLVSCLAVMVSFRCVIHVTFNLLLLFICMLYRTQPSLTFIIGSCRFQRHSILAWLGHLRGLANMFWIHSCRFVDMFVILPFTFLFCWFLIWNLVFVWQTFQIKRLAHAVKEGTLDNLITELLLWLLDERVPLMDDGSQLLKALNVLMLKILVCKNSFSCFPLLVTYAFFNVSVFNRITPREHPHLSC